jgi:dissimilatory sulfite reductase related protein
MQIITLAGREFEADEEGFLQDPALWTEDVGRDLAAAEGIESLNEDHWKVIHLLREYHGKFNVAPPVQMVCKRTGLEVKQVRQLFPGGLVKCACKVAGLPKPTGCI